ncbi:MULTISPECIES: lipopolysaccharide biosynthesis protein [Olivibacter]|uniref:Lipopolysaccharide biosynthesis protein n=1 Tax=Olivibacter jilunii TaxID=985016 RepID=A0ABW6B7I4_9SPHI
MAQSGQTSLAKLTMIYVIGNFSSKIFSFLLVFVMTYFLTREEIGQYDLIITTASFIVPCVSLLIDGAVLRWLLDDPSEENRKKVLGNAFVMLGFNVLIYSVLFWVLYQITDIKYAEYLYLLTLFQICLPVLQQGARGIGKNKLYATIGVVYSFLNVISTVVFLVVIKTGVEGVLIANIISVALVVAYLLIRLGWIKYISFKYFDRDFLKTLVVYSLPLLPNSLSWWLVGSATRYTILLYLGVQSNGIFAISYKYPTILLVLSNVFNLAWQEKAIKEAKSEQLEQRFSDTLEKYAKFLLCLIIVLSCTSRFFIENFVSKEFVEAWKYMPILLYAVFLQAISAFYGASYLSTKKTVGVFTSSLTGGLVTVLTSFPLTKLYGLYGVSFSILLGYFIMLAIRIKQTKSFINVKFPTVLVGGLTLMFLFVSASNYYYRDSLFVLCLILSLSLVVFLNKSYINKIKTKFNNGR